MQLFEIEFIYKGIKYKGKFYKIREGENSTNQFEVIEIEPPLLNAPSMILFIVNDEKNGIIFPQINPVLSNLIWEEIVRTCRINNISLFN